MEAPALIEKHGLPGPGDFPTGPVGMEDHQLALAALPTSRLARSGGSLLGRPRAQPSSAASNMSTSTTNSSGSGDWRAPFRLPVLSPDGCLVGYRQNSGAFRKQVEEVLDHETNHEEELGEEKDAEIDEFAAAAADPLCSFPDAANRVPGYLLGPVIGRGGFSTVHKALHIATRLLVAIKIVPKSRLVDPKDRDRVDREARAMRALGGHVCIAQLLEVVETPDAIHLVMEHCAGGTLLDHVRAARRLPEPEACMLFQQLIAALNACHARGIAHRDVKLENVLLDGAGGLRLTDFGLCGYYAPGKALRCHCGSPSYAAPEIVGRRDYMAPPVDVWSAGVVLYAMLAGHLPFYGPDKKALSQKIAAGAWRTPDGVSAPAVTLLRQMLELDPGARATLAEVAAHPWVTGGPRWEGPGEGPSGLVRPGAGAVPDAAAVTAWAATQGPGADVQGLMRSLRLRECNSLSAGYHLICLKKMVSGEAAAAAVPVLPLRAGCLRPDDSSDTTDSSSAPSSPDSSLTAEVLDLAGVFAAAVERAS